MNSEKIKEAINTLTNLINAYKTEKLQKVEKVILEDKINALQTALEVMGAVFKVKCGDENLEYIIKYVVEHIKDYILANHFCKREELYTKIEFDGVPKEYIDEILFDFRLWLTKCLGEIRRILIKVYGCKETGEDCTFNCKNFVKCNILEKSIKDLFYK